MRKFYFLTVLVLATFMLHAQVANYSFTQSTGAYTPITGTAVGTTTWDDETIDNIPIGFSFNYNGTAYTNISVGSNGYIAFATGAISNNTTPISSSITNAAGIIAAMARDLINNGVAITSATSGAVGSRVFTVQWTNARRYSGGAVSGDVLNFQIRLFETSNKIEIVYGTNTATSTTSLSVQVGIRGATTTDYLNRTSSTNWAATTAGSSNSATVTTSNTIMPPTGLTFTYNPPPPCVAPSSQPTALNLTTVSAGQINGSFTAASGSPSGYFVVVYPNGSPVTNPTDATSYTTGTTLGAGTIVSVGPATSFTASNLSGGSTYNFYVYAYNNTACSSGPIFLTPSPLSGSQTTTTCITGGTYTIDNSQAASATNFTSFSAAVNFLNLYTVCGLTNNLTVNVAAGQTFTEDVPALTLSGNASANIIFQKVGSGANPVIKPTGGSGSSDFGFAITGGDYVTFDGIDISIATGSAVEYGILIRNAGATNGASNITIKNVSITLNKANTSSIGILQTSTSTGGGITATAASGANSNNKYYNLTIKNSYNGILLSGGTTSFDLNNEVGTLNGGSTTIGASYSGVPTGDIGNGSSSVFGIQAANQSGVKVFNTTVQNLTGTSTTRGIYLNSAVGASYVYNNKVSGLRSTSTTSTSGVNGMELVMSTSGTNTLNAYNNFVWDITSAYTGAASASRQLKGILLGSGSATSAYSIDHNSVLIDGSGSPTISSVALELGGSTAQNNVRNNILANITGAQTGIAKHYTIVATATSVYGGTGSVVNNNDYYIANATNGFVGLGNSADVTTLTDLRVKYSQDVNSKSSNPQFVSATNLHINTSIPTEVESGGIALAAITTDIDGEVRNATTPDIGADEGTFIYADFNAPVISYTTLTYTCSTGDRTLSGVSIIDASGVPATGNLVPRIYYKKSTGATWFSKPGVLASGSGTNGTWSFTITVADLGPLATSDIIQYYVIAQDLAASPNISSFTVGVVATDVNSVTTHPASPNNYTINTGLSGSYNVGSGGNFTTLTAAVAAYNAGCPNGAITFNLTDAAYGSSETFPIIINGNIFSSVSNALTIKPATGVTSAITGSDASALIKLNGADYVTIDGSNNGSASRNLTVSNTNTGTSSAVIWVSSASATDGATNNTIKNVNVKGNSSTTTLFGIFSGGGTISNTGTATAANNNNTYNNNSFTSSQYGLYSGGVSITSRNTGTVITQNQINGTGTNVLDIGGILVRNEDGVVISQNTISNIGGTSGTKFAISLGSTSTNTSSPGTADAVINATVSNNKISNISTTGTNSAFGLVISSATAGTTTVFNNFIAGVNGNATPSDFTAGLYIGGGAGSTTKVYYNNISMSGAGTRSTPSIALAIGGSNPIVDVRNNILVNTSTTSVAGANAKSFAFVTASSSSSNLTFDYNDLFVSGANAVFAGTASISAPTAQADLNALNSAIGGGTHSLNVQPVFASASDLHLSIVSNLALDNKGVSISGFTTDIDAETRSALTPDMGADEFTTPAGCLSTPTAGTITGNPSVCTGNGIALALSGHTIDLGITYQWQSSTTSGGPFTDISGATDQTYNTGNLTSAMYYQVLITCTNTSQSITTPVFALMVNPLPTITAVAANPSICAGSSTTLTAGGASSYVWSPSTNLSSTTDPTVTTTTTRTIRYKVTGTDVNGCVNSSNVDVVVNPAVVATASASAIFICQNGSAQLSSATTLINYGLTSIPHNPLSSGGTGTVLVANGTEAVPLSSGALDDGRWEDLPLPFAFKFYGIDYSALTVSTNGYITFGTPSTSSGYNAVLPSTGTPNNTIHLVTADLDFRSPATGQIEYFVVGTAPNRKFVVSFSDASFYNATATPPSSPGTVTAQAILYEGTNAIEIHTTSLTNTTKNKAQGIENAQGTVATVVPGRNNTTVWTGTPDAYRFTVNPITYTWSPTTFLNDPAIANPVASNLTASTVYSVTIADAVSGCSGTASVSLAVGQPLVANVSASQTAVCYNTPVTIAAAPTGGGTPYTYSWSNGTSVVSTSQSFTATPLSTTTYSLTLTDACGTVVTNAVTVTVNSPAVTSTTPATRCGIGTAVLQATGASGATLNWYMAATGGTAIGTGSSFTTPVISATTTYYVGASSPSTCEGPRVAVVVTVTTPPSITVSATNPAICVGQSSTISVTSANAGYSYSWTLGGQTTASFSVTPSASTKYVVTAQDNSTGVNAGCVNKDSITIFVNSLPLVPVITANPAAICLGASATLSTPALSSSTAYVENFDGALTSSIISTSNTTAGTEWQLHSSPFTSANTTPVTFSSPGNNRFMLANSDIGGSGSVTNSDIVTPAINTNGYTGAYLKFNHYYRHFSGDFGYVEVSTNGGTTWTVLKAYNTTVGSPTAFVSDSINLDAYINSSIVIRFHYDATFDYFWAIDDISVYGIKPLNYSWVSAGGTGLPSGVGSPSATNNSVVVTPTTAGTNTYTVTATNTVTGCLVSNAVSVIVNTLPVITTQPQSMAVCSGGTATFSVNASGGGLTYQWKKDGVNIAGATTSILTINNAGNGDLGSYTVVITGTCAPTAPITSAAAMLTLAANNSWVGISNNDWNNPTNWCGSVPTSTTDVVIPAGTLYAPILTANGSVRNLTIASGATMTINATGRLSLYGDLVTTGTFNATAGSIVFSGTTNQNIPSITVANAVLNGAGGITLSGNMTVGTALTLINGNIALGSNNLVMTGGSIGSVSSHIITNGTGGVTANNVGTATVVFPVGPDAASYNPAQIAVGGGRNFSVRVATGINPAIATNNRAINRTWTITPSAASATPANVTLQYADADANAAAVPAGVMEVGINSGTAWSVVTVPNGVTPTGTATARQVALQTTTFGPMVVANLGSVLITTAIPNLDADITSAQLLPNIVKDKAVLHIVARRSMKINWTITDGAGRIVMSFSKQAVSGQNDIHLFLGHLAGGTYYLTGDTGKGKIGLLRFVRD